MCPENREENKMIKLTQKALKDMVSDGSAWDISHMTETEYCHMKRDEGNFRKIGYSCGKYGTNGLLLQGCKSGRWYAITSRTTAIFYF